MKLQKLQIKSFTSSAYDDNIIEKQANKWIRDNYIDVRDIRYTYDFWTGYKCIVIYKLP
jgi:hypothetical protein